MGNLYDKGLDFKCGALSLDSQMVNIHYNLECQDITDNTGDNKLWLFQSIQRSFNQLKWVIFMIRI